MITNEIICGEWPLNEDDAIAIMFANLKGSKNKPSGLLQVAKACRFLKEKYGSIVKLSELLGVSRSMLQQIDRLNDLSPDVKKSLDELGIDKAYQISRLPLEKQTEAAQEVAKMRANPDARLFVDYMLEKQAEGVSVGEYKKRFLGVQPKMKKMHVLALPLTDETFNELKKLASHSMLNVHDYVLHLLEEHIDDKKEKR